MASQTGQEAIALDAPKIIQDLLKQPKKFNFLQAVRLLYFSEREKYNDFDDFLRRGLKVTPYLSLAHPSTDMESVTKTKDQQYQIIATFLSLYGASSPLPTFYTEELLDEASSDESASRDFIDIFNQSIYTLYTHASNASRLAFRTLEQQDKQMLDMQYALLGMGEENLRQNANTRYEDLRFINLFTRYSSSAHNLEQYLAVIFKVKVEVEQCAARKVSIPSWQYSCLGQSSLGEAVIGQIVHDFEGKFTIHLLDLDAETMKFFQPGQPGRLNLQRTVRQYLKSPLEYDLVLHAKACALPLSSLGESKLGSSFLASPQHDEKTVRYYC